MQITVSKKLIDAYDNQGKKPNYALSFLLNSMDPIAYVDGIKLVDVFTISGETISVDVDDKNVRILQKIYGSIDMAIVERLLWVALLFPEI